MNKFKLLALSAFLASAIGSQATVTLQFSTASAKLTNIQNDAGTASGNLRWGIVVDTTNNGFYHNGTNTYDGFTFPAAGAGVFLNQGDVGTGPTTDDFFYFGASNNLTLSSVPGTDAGTNAIGTLSGVPLASGVSAGDTFALIWFDTSTTNDGDKYGFFTDPAFIIPADGSTVNFNQVVGGTDPVRNASFTLGAVAIPEPSRALLAGFGLLGFLMRRRRA
jgi:hypothetical protein